MLARTLQVVAVIGSAASVTSQPCTADGKCTDNLGHVWDLSSIGAEQATTPALPDPTWNSYAIQLYTNLNPVPAACTNAGRLGTNAAVFDSDTSSSDCSQIGPDMNQPIVPPTLTSAGGSLTFRYNYKDDTTGDNVLQVTLTCGSGLGTPAPVVAADQGGTGWLYTTTWATSVVCKGGAGGGFEDDVEEIGTFGVVVCCLFFIGGAFYAGGGWYYNHRTKGYTGKEALPHIEFWRTIPGLVKDGVEFTKGHVQAKINGGTYEGSLGSGGDDETTAVRTGKPASDAEVSAPGTPSKKKKKKKKTYSKVSDETEEEAKE